MIDAAARRAAQRPARLARAGQPPRLLRRAARRRAWSPRPAARSGSSRRSRPPGGDRPSAARARAPSRWSPTRRSSSTSRTPPTRPASRSRRAASTRSAPGPVLSRGSTLNQRLFELLYDDRRGRADPVHAGGDRRARPAPTPTPCTSAAAACRRRSSRSRSATCTRPSSSCSSTTSTPRARRRFAARCRPALRALTAPSGSFAALTGALRGRAQAASSSVAATISYGSPGEPPIASMRRPCGPGEHLARVSGADAHERVAVELHALAFDLDPARAAQRDEDLLLRRLRVVVLGVVGVVGRQLDHLHAERRHSELGAGLHESRRRSLPPCP